MTDELINLLREIRPSFSDVGSRDVDTRREQNQIDRAIELLSASKPAVPEGWKVVPIEPSEEMIQAACLKQSNTVFESYAKWFDSHSSGISVRIRQLVAGNYRAMFAAFPAAPSAESVDSQHFVQPVPDHCDRIVWRGSYYGLPPAAPAQSEEAVAWLVEWQGKDQFSDETWVHAHANELTARKQAHAHGGTCTALYAAPQPAQTAQSGESAHEKALDALKVADRFCNSLTSEVCPDDVAIPIKDALRALTLAAPAKGLNMTPLTAQALNAIHEFLGVAQKKIYPQPDKPQSDWAKLKAAVDGLALLASIRPSAVGLDDERATSSPGIRLASARRRIGELEAELAQARAASLQPAQTARPDKPVGDGVTNDTAAWTAHCIKQPVEQTEPLRDDWQQKAINYGFKYWRASDSHGITATNEQAVELLQELLGVEVEIEAQTERALTPASIEATSALIANSLLGAAPEEDVREVERLINEMLGRT